MNGNDRAGKLTANLINRFLRAAVRAGYLDDLMDEIEEILFTTPSSEQGKEGEIVPSSLIEKSLDDFNEAILESMDDPLQIFLYEMAPKSLKAHFHNAVKQIFEIAQEHNVVAEYGVPNRTSQGFRDAVRGKLVKVAARGYQDYIGELLAQGRMNGSVEARWLGEAVARALTLDQDGGTNV